MAKLSARGRVEVFRVEVMLPDTELCVNRVDTYALMSDRVMLRKLTVHFRPDAFKPQGYAHSYGWTVARKLRQGHARVAFDALVAAGAGVVKMGDFGLVGE